MAKYPASDINPNLKKGAAFLLQYAQAVWHDCGHNIPDNMFYRAAWKYKTIRDHALGKQDTIMYKKPYIDESGKTFATNMDYRVRPLLSKFRDIAISKLLQRDFNIIATAIDSLAKDESESYYAKLKVKILMKEALQKAGSELVDSPVLQKEPDEPGNMDELKMQMEYGDKFNRSIDAEQTWELVSYLNNFVEARKKTLTNFFDFGVGGYKDSYDRNHGVKLRAVNPSNFITSYCREGDFSDMTHAGEIIEVPLSDLEGEFSEAELKAIADTANVSFNLHKGEIMNTKDRSKVAVLDLELKSTDTLVYSQRITAAGNVAFGRDDFKYRGIREKIKVNGKDEEKYKDVGKDTIYKVKWIIGTKYIYDYGEAKNQKRDIDKPALTTLSYHIYAYNFDQMTAQGKMEGLMPIFDEYMATVLKVQHFKNNWIPYIIDIDLDALENVALGKAGENMKPMDLLNFMFQTKVILSRRKDISNTNINYKSVNIQATQMAQEFTVLLTDMTRLIQEMRDVSGLNELTDGSTPDSKTLTTIANMADQGTNNALYPIMHADRNLLERVAKSAIQRVQTAIKNGRNVEGVVHALGSNTVKFIRASKDLPLHVYGIKIEDMPTEQEKQMLLEKMNLKDAEGMIEPEDWVVVMYTKNIKQAGQYLAYSVKKRRDKQQADAMAMQQQNGQIQVQSAQAAEKAKQETLRLEFQLKTEHDMAIKQIEKEITAMKIASAEKIAEMTTGGKVLGQTLGHEAAERKARMDNGLPVENAEVPVLEEEEMAMEQEQNIS